MIFYYTEFTGEKTTKKRTPIRRDLKMSTLGQVEKDLEPKITCADRVVVAQVAPLRVNPRLEFWMQVRTS